MTKTKRFKLVFSSTLFMFFVTFNSFALNYTISFSGSGASTTIDNIIVQNLTQGTTVTVPANNTLNLVSAVTASVNQIDGNANINILQHAETGITTISLYAQNEGLTQVSIYSIDGRKAASLNQKLSQGVNSFDINLPKGLFVLQVNGTEFNYTGKIINSTGTSNPPNITFIGTSEQQSLKPQKVNRDINSTTQLVYNTGDCLLYKAKSGNNTTVVTEVPTDTHSINFNFIACQDADLNSYSTVTIGTQTWMVENLRTSKYQDGSTIPNVTVNSTWVGLTTGACCDYNNDATIYDGKYGKLYNWYAVNDSRKIAPTGWHVASDAEWTTLTNFVAAHLGTSLSPAKSLAANTDWTNYSATGTIGCNLAINNYSGFSALPGGFRSSSVGWFFDVGSSGYCWSSNEVNNAGRIVYALSRYLHFDSGSVSSNQLTAKMNGFSVRCVRD